MVRDAGGNDTWVARMTSPPPLPPHYQELADLRVAYEGGKVMAERSVQDSQVWGGSVNVLGGG